MQYLCILVHYCWQQRVLWTKQKKMQRLLRIIGSSVQFDTYLIQFNEMQLDVRQLAFTDVPSIIRRTLLEKS